MCLPAQRCEPTALTSPPEGRASSPIFSLSPNTGGFSTQSVGCTRIYLPTAGRLFLGEGYPGAHLQPRPLHTHLHRVPAQQKQENGQQEAEGGSAPSHSDVSAKISLRAPPPLALVSPSLSV